MPVPVYIWRVTGISDLPEANSTMQMVRGHTWWNERVGQTHATYDIMDGYQIDDTHAIYLVENRPGDWTGDGYLETVELPYRMIRRDSRGVLERVGEWFRFIGAAGSASDLGTAAAAAAGLSLPGFSAGKKE